MPKIRASTKKTKPPIITAKTVKPWKLLVDEAIRSLPKDFTLDQMLQFEDGFAASYPTNKNIDAKIRQTLQILCDQGTIEFLGSGRYRRLNVSASFSLQLEAPSAKVKSRSQKSGYVVETWVEANLYCVNCGKSLRRLPINHKVADFDCVACGEHYQVKTSLKHFTKKYSERHSRPFMRLRRKEIRLTTFWLK